MNAAILSWWGWKTLPVHLCTSGVHLPLYVDVSVPVMVNLILNKSRGYRFFECFYVDISL